MSEAQKEATKNHTEQMGAAQMQNQALQGQLKTLNDNQVKLQELHKKQQEELTKRIACMQDINTRLQQNLENITAKNAQSLTELGQAKERARDLERQMVEISQHSSGNIWKWICFLVVILFFATLILR